MSDKRADMDMTYSLTWYIYNLQLIVSVLHRPTFQDFTPKKWNNTHILIQTPARYHTQVNWMSDKEYTHYILTLLLRTLYKNYN